MGKEGAVLRMFLLPPKFTLKSNLLQNSDFANVTALQGGLSVDNESCFLTNTTRTACCWPFCLVGPVGRPSADQMPVPGPPAPSLQNCESEFLLFVHHPDSGILLQ